MAARDSTDDTAGAETLRRNSEFTLDATVVGYAFLHKNGSRVRTDELGKAIWDDLPATAAALAEKACRALGIERELAGDFLRVMMAAGIVKPPLPGREGPFGSGESRLESPAAAKPVTAPESGPAPESAPPAEPCPTISVVIVTHNSDEHIRGCLDSLQRQRHQNLEIIIVDNGSKDQTSKIIREDFPRAKLMEMGKNLHFAAAVNRGIEEAGGDSFLILNPDVELEEGCIRELAAKLRGAPQAAAAVPMMKFYHLRGFINGIGNHIRDRGWGSDNFIGLVDIGQFAGLEEVPSACFAAALLRRAAVEDVGLLDRKYGSYYEDTDWSFRCGLRGWRIVPAVRAVVYHKFGPHWKHPVQKLRLVARNRQRLVLKIFGGRRLLRFLRNYLTEDIRNAISLLRKKDFGRAFAYPAAYFSLLTSLPDIAWKRRKVRRARIGGASEATILAKNPEFFNGLDEENLPVLDTQMIRNYYGPEMEKLSASIRKYDHVSSCCELK